jgi:hypothetical protein
LCKQAKQAAAQTNLLRQRTGDLQTRQQELEQRNTQLAGKQQLIKAVLDGERPPVPVWLLGYLGEALPADLSATNLEVKWEDNLWKLSLAGTLQATSKPPVSLTLSNAVGVLADRLATGPFHLTILHRSDRAEPAREKSGVAGGWPAKSNSQTPEDNQFKIEGVMK